MVQADGVTLHSDGLPWWLFDMRPQGYLGRAYASTHAAGLGLPANPEHWSDTEVIRALLAHGQDAVGNLLIGELARDRFIGMPTPLPADRAADYPALARTVGTGRHPAHQRVASSRNSAPIQSAVMYWRNFRHRTITRSANDGATCCLPNIWRFRCLA